MIRRKKDNPLGNNQRGAVLLLLLVAVTLLGLMAGIAGSSWQTLMQRSKEEDLLWKGNQLRQAIGRYYEFSGAGAEIKPTAKIPQAVKKFPATLDDLLEDPRALEVTRHLRRLYPDPLTGEEWELILSPAGGGIMGVKSSSTQIPLKQAGFSAENKGFTGQQSYQGWAFIYRPASQPQQQSANLQGTQSSDSSSN